MKVEYPLKYKVTCKICGKEFIAKSTRKKLCSAVCQRESALIVSRNYHKRERAKKANAMKAKKSKETIVDIAVKAKQAGMSYGQYSAMLMLQKESD